MKKFFIALAMFATTLAVSAQSSDTPFEKGQVYVGAGFSGLNLNYNSKSKWNLDIDARGGYFIQDNWMLLGEFLWGIRTEADNAFLLGAGARYYIVQNGIYLGAGVNYKHSGSCNDVMPTVQVGYAFFLSRTVTVEPSVYYNQSFKEHSDYSKIGLKIGIGVYL